MITNIKYTNTYYGANSTKSLILPKWGLGVPANADIDEDKLQLDSTNNDIIYNTRL